MLSSPAYRVAARLTGCFVRSPVRCPAAALMDGFLLLPDLRCENEHVGRIVRQPSDRAGT